MRKSQLLGCTTVAKEAIARLYTEGFLGEEHLAQIQVKAQEIIQAAYSAAGL